MKVRTNPYFLRERKIRLAKILLNHLCVATIEAGVYNRLIIVLFLCITLTACASPAQIIDNKAFTHGFEKLELHGLPFTHVSYRNIKKNNTKRLHVYIEGDGTISIARRWVSTDPTPRKGLMLELMSLDPQPSLYLGRPCYFGQASNPPCSPLLWTFQRYSQQVVLSMVSALNNHLKLQHYDELVFFGHSGGGALALLIAPHFGQTVTIVTLGANLDIDAWTDHHSFTRLFGSLNPAFQPTLPPHITQIHYAGEDDHNVPPSIVENSLSNQPHSQFRLLKGVNHTCCWQNMWPDVLREIDGL